MPVRPNPISLTLVTIAAINETPVLGIQHHSERIDALKNLGDG
ncbi:MAG TPA: hypothetical protein O0X23_04385 [Methanocorpusculum sp.]|nr:hypothetical protein [Methanocorpusculum sp.]